MTAFAIVSLLLAEALLLALSNEHGYQRGHDKGFLKGHGDGYLEGRKDADNWWLEVESEAGSARKKIWREEAER